MTHVLKFATVLSAMIFSGAGAQAQDCPVSITEPFDLEAADIASIYDCIGDKMPEGYSKGGDMVAKDYRNWTVTGTRHGVAGAHGNRLLMTYANDIAAEQYLKFAEDGVVMPVGSILAKESIKINKKKQAAVVGPLFIMTKLEAGAAAETNDWLYGGIQPNGKPMKFRQAFCHDCHSSWEDQDFLAYPLEEVRVGN